MERVAAKHSYEGEQKEPERQYLPNRQPKFGFYKKHEYEAQSPMILCAYRHRIAQQRHSVLYINGSEHNRFAWQMNAHVTREDHYNYNSGRDLFGPKMDHQLKSCDFERYENRRVEEEVYPGAESQGRIDKTVSEAYERG